MKRKDKKVPNKSQRTEEYNNYTEKSASRVQLHTR